MFELVKADLRRARELNRPGDDRFTWLRQFFHFGTQAVLAYRFARWAYLCPVPGLRQVLQLLAWPSLIASKLLLGVHLHAVSDIGPGFVVHTVNGVYIGETRIGRNFTVNHGVVIRWTVPEIGDDVYFGPGAKVPRAIRIGSRVKVGANAVVLEDVPDDSLVVGVPGRIISRPPPTESAQTESTSASSEA